MANVTKLVIVPPVPVLEKLFTKAQDAALVFRLVRFKAPVKVAVFVMVARLRVLALNASCAAPLPAFTFTAEVTVTLFSADTPPTTSLKLMLPVEPAVSCKLNVPSSVPPKTMFAPVGVPEEFVLSTMLLPISVAPPVPKSISAPGLRMIAPISLGALPSTSKLSPPLNKNKSVPATSPKVTRPLLRKLVLVTKLFDAPTMVTVYGLTVVIKSVT